MPAQSKAQQKFMGMVHATQKGDMNASSPEVAAAAKSMSKKSAKDFASTKHKGLPDKVESVSRLKEYIRKMVREMNVTGNVQGYQTPNAFKPRGDEKSSAKKQADLTGYSVVSENIKKLDNETLFKIYNLPKGAKKASAKREKYGWTIKYTSPTTGGNADGFLSDERVKRFLDGKLKESKLSFSQLKKGDILIGKFPPYKELEVLSADSKSAKVKSLKQKNVFDINSFNNYKLKEIVQENRWTELKNEDTPANAKIGRGISNINKQLAEMEKFLNWYGKLKQESGISNENYWKRTNGNIMKIKERLIRLESQIRKISE